MRDLGTRPGEHLLMRHFASRRGEALMIGDRIANRNWLLTIIPVCSILMIY